MGDRAIGLSLTLGAFLGGMIIAETPYRPIIRSEIKPFRGLLLGFFFISVGLSLDLGALIRFWPAVIGVAVLLLVVKFSPTPPRASSSAGRCRDRHSSASSSPKAPSSPSSS